MAFVVMFGPSKVKGCHRIAAVVVVTQRRHPMPTEAFLKVLPSRLQPLIRFLSMSAIRAASARCCVGNFFLFHLATILYRRISSWHSSVCHHIAELAGPFADRAMS